MTLVMDSKGKSILFAALAAVMAASSAPPAADKNISHIFIVLPLVAMGFFLCVAGYYAGQSKGKDR